MTADRKALLFGVFLQSGSMTDMAKANRLLANPVTDATLRTWFSRWRKLGFHATINRFGRY